MAGRQRYFGFDVDILNQILPARFHCPRKPATLPERVLGREACEMWFAAGICQHQGHDIRQEGQCHHTELQDVRDDIRSACGWCASLPGTAVSRHAPPPAQLPRRRVGFENIFYRQCTHAPSVFLVSHPSTISDEHARAKQEAKKKRPRSSNVLEGTNREETNQLEDIIAEWPTVHLAHLEGYMSLAKCFGRCSFDATPKWFVKSALVNMNTAPDWSHSIMTKATPAMMHNPSAKVFDLVKQRSITVEEAWLIQGWPPQHRLADRPPVCRGIGEGAFVGGPEGTHWQQHACGPPQYFFRLPYVRLPKVA